MKTKTGILALGLFTLSGVVVVSCGGSSDSGDTSTGGTTSTSGTGTGGSVSGSNSSGGTVNNTSGTATGGTTNGGSNNAGGNNNNAGAPDNAGGAPANAGGAGNGMPGCPATAPTDGSACMRVQGMAAFCSYDNNMTICTCQRVGGGQMRQWQCNDINIGAGGAGGATGGFGQATCPANGMNGDQCSNGPGLCAGQRCFCGNNDTLTCF